MSDELTGAKVFVVEDDFLIQLDIVMSLEAAGAEVIAAGSVSDGLAKLRDDFDAAVLDIRLPDGEVFPVAEELVARNTPIIFHSGNVDHSNLENRFPDALALSKPAHERILIEAVNRRRVRH